jgi:glycosyltransferase involved in cell wall biosynthesis
VDIVVPVYNEESDLGPSIRRLHAFLSNGFPFPARITVADNASTDATWTLAQQLAEELPGVRAVHLDRKGRGWALRSVWQASDATVLAYMDVDLSTGRRSNHWPRRRGMCSCRPASPASPRYGGRCPGRPVS